MRVLHIVFVAFLMFTGSSVFAAKPIENIIDFPIPTDIDGGKYSIESVKNAILSACRKRGWTPVDDGKNTITASIFVRSHYAEITIPYTDEKYSIYYKSSKNLDYSEKKQKIHRNYNRWVFMLTKSIQREFNVRAQGY